MPLRKHGTVSALKIILCYQPAQEPILLKEMFHSVLYCFKFLKNIKSLDCFPHTQGM